MNRTSMQRGMTVSTTFKKYSDTITKNTGSGQDDIFMKPDRNKVTGMMDSNFYNKLNDKGYVPEETVITNGDVIIGKVSPIQAGSNNTKLYKDESEIYKSTVAGTVDKVYTGIYNSDGYEMYNMRIRSERTPMIGDKLCMTGDHKVLTNNGWIQFDELYKRYQTDNAFRSELKVAQLNNNNLEYITPIDVFEFDYNGRMYNLESEYIDFKVTEEHMLYVKTINNDFELIEAKQVFENYTYNDIEFKTMNETLIITDYKGKIKIIDYNGKVYCLQVPSNIFMVKLNEKNHWTGNCSRHGQKGTVGILLPATDMPFTESGIQPDIIINPCCIPSRMTIGQLFESVFSKVAAIRGEMIDATPFNNIDFNKITAELKEYGFDEHGYEHLYCGMTGKKIICKLFIGLTNYLRLKHIVQDKIHSRATGPRQRLTRQPPDGRAREGGLRFGEMERDAMISHGCSLFLKERFVDTSDIYTCHICSKCGLIASKKIDKEIYICLACNKLPENQGEMAYATKIVLPYAFKLLVQELMTINIVSRIRIKDDIYTNNA